MPRPATGKLRPSGPGFEARLRSGLNGERESYFLAAFTRADEDAARDRTTAMATIATRLRKAGLGGELPRLLDMAACARPGRAWEAVLAAVEALVAGLTEEITGEAPVTFEKFAEEWTDGTLSERYPDHIRKKRSSGRDEELLRLYVNPKIGTKQLASVTVEDCEAIMADLPATLATGTRRHVAQVTRRVLAIAVYPGRHRTDNPVPRGWLPRVRRTKAKAMVFPSEDRQLLACLKEPLLRRLAYGFLGREGMRTDEMATLRWRDVDLERGMVHLDENKTDDPRSWALGPDVWRALKLWQKRDGAKGDALAFAVKEIGINVERLAEQLRADLRKAAVNREQLFEDSETRQQVRAHDFRGLFCTVNLANGKTERGVKDRTGHNSEALDVYVRPARQWAEAGLGVLADLDAAIPELADATAKKLVPPGDTNSFRCDRLPRHCPGRRRAERERSSASR